MKKCILIGGTGRSGSNVLKEILSTQKDAASLFFEPRYILDPDGIVDFYQSMDNWSPYNIDFKLRRLFNLLEAVGKVRPKDGVFKKLHEFIAWDKQQFSLPQYCHWELEKHIPGFIERVQKLKEDLEVFEFSNNWIGSESYKFNNSSLFTPFTNKEEIKNIFSNFILENINAFLNTLNKEIYIDDSTFNLLHAESLFQLIPNSKLIHIYRNPMDVVCSLKSQSWAPTNLEKVLSWYKSTIKHCLEVKNKLPADFYLEIKFEDLVLNTSGILNRISEFTQVDFSSLEDVVDLKHHNIGRWKNDLTVDQQKKLNHSLKEEKQILGY